MSFTGNKDTDFIILDKLDDKELGRLCQSDKYVATLCENETFWLNRLMRVYSVSPQKIDEMRKYLFFQDNKELYIWLKKYFSKNMYQKSQFPLFLNSISTKLPKLWLILSKK